MTAVAMVARWGGFPFSTDGLYKWCGLLYGAMWCGGTFVGINLHITKKEYKVCSELIYIEKIKKIFLQSIGYFTHFQITELFSMKNLKTW